MKNNYLVEITQRQMFFVAVEAESAEQAINKVMSKQGKVESSYPPEIEQVNAKILRGDYG